MEIVVHTKTICPWCDMAKNWLDEKGYNFKIVVHDETSERQIFYENCGDGVRSVPQIFLDGERIGGYTDLLNSDLNNFNISFNKDF